MNENNKNLLNWLSPIWTNGTIFEEPVCFYEDAEKNIKGGKLLYAPDSITSIMNYDASIVYEEDRDYKITEDGICLLKSSRIPILHRKEYIASFTGEPDDAWLCLPGKEQLVQLFPEIHKYQVLVTYESHHDSWNGYIPEKQGTKLKNTYNKLENGESLHIVFYGDSITAGWEASGANEQAVDMNSLEPDRVHFDRYPHMPVWPQLVTDQLRTKYPTATITKDNLSAGGSTAKWGLRHVNELFDRVSVPDLVFIGFGMNCMWDKPDVFLNYISGIRNELCKRNPDCEFVLYPAMVANPEMAVYQQQNMRAYEVALKDYAAHMPGIVVAPVHSMFRELQNRGKEYYEISGNAVNHPNDFSIRLYAQTIWETISQR